MIASWMLPFIAEADAWRGRLGSLGFGDDGVRLRGFIGWRHPTRGQIRARIEVEPDDRFPFAPPAVRVLDPGVDMELTFHLDRSTADNAPGNLCLWDTDLVIDQAPWRDPQVLLDRVQDWLERTAAGWPDDHICDLERYLEPDATDLVLYDADLLAAVRGPVRTAHGPTRNTIIVTDQRRRRPLEPQGNRRIPRKDRRLAWIGDLGAIEAPLRDWPDIARQLGDHSRTVVRLISFGAVNRLLLWYTRGGRSGALAVSVRPGPTGIIVKSCESADTSIATRSLRAGVVAQDLVNTRIAIVGLGAVGSFAADFLFRSGVRHMTLLDPERLRPGNVVRHLGGVNDIGDFKVAVVKRHLDASGFDVDRVATRVRSVVRLRQAVDLVREHNVVLDATANGRASSLLFTAAEIMGRGTGHTVISACVQREGQVIRSDRFPLRMSEQHLPPLHVATIPAIEEVREHGCGEAISRTPPGAVIAAAELATRMVIDQATFECMLPASMADVRQVQTEAPFDRLGFLTPANSHGPVAS